MSEGGDGGGVVLCGPYYHQLPDGVGTKGVFTEGPRVSYMLPYFALNAHKV